jgi:metallo-beta-lactamase family protein
MKLTSYGAAGEVTGSQHVLEVNGKKILLDCGLFQGRRKEAYEKNVGFNFSPASIDAVLLSHAHIDHTGNVPNLIKKGFKHTVYCTEATKALCDVMLLDSAHIQESDATYFARRLPETALKMEPIYTIADAEFALQFFQGKPYNHTFELFDDIKVTFREAGHVLGSAIIILDIKDREDGKQKRFVYTGDLGRTRLPILKDPYEVKEADYLVCESTYGARTHLPMDMGIPELARIINRTAERGGKIIIPAFSLERTQELIYGLHTLYDEKKIPEHIPVFIDSPLATSVTAIFERFDELYDEDIKKVFKGKHNPFRVKQIKHTQSVEESKKLNQYIGPCIIISASGMCEAGRIRHHLRNNIENPRNSIVLVGYQAENTLGRKLVDHNPMVKIFDQMFKVNAEVVSLESFSAHADMNDLDEFIKRIKGLKKIMLVHGELSQSTLAAERLNKLTHVEVVISKPQEAIAL